MYPQVGLFNKPKVRVRFASFVEGCPWYLGARHKVKSPTLSRCDKGRATCFVR